MWRIPMKSPEGVSITAGFFLMGPFICCGVYELSRQREEGTPPDLTASLLAWRRNVKSIAFFAAILTFLMKLWEMAPVLDPWCFCSRP